MRLFIGSFLGKEIVEKIPTGDIQSLFKADLKKSTKENIHMTWIFLGNVEQGVGPRLQETIDKHIDIFKGLIFTSEGLCFWPPKKSSRLIVIKGNLNKKINLLDFSFDLKQFCNPDIKENFIPHITVCRFKQDKTINKKMDLPKMGNFIWHIKEISLVESILSSEGPIYTKIKSWQVN